MLAGVVLEEPNRNGEVADVIGAPVLGLPKVYVDAGAAASSDLGVTSWLPKGYLEDGVELPNADTGAEAGAVVLLNPKKEDFGASEREDVAVDGLKLEKLDGAVNVPKALPVDDEVSAKADLFPNIDTAGVFDSGGRSVLALELFREFSNSVCASKRSDLYFSNISAMSTNGSVATAFVTELKSEMLRPRRAE